MPTKKTQKTGTLTPEQLLIEQLNKQIETLEIDKKSLEKELEEANDMTKRAQYDYINLKMDFDRYQKQQRDAAADGQLEQLITVVQKFAPFVDNIRKSLENITDEIKQSPLGKGVQLVYDKFLATLEQMHITPIEALGLEPDNFLHEPVSVMPTTDESQKGKIVQEFERGFVYRKGDVTKVVSTSKVVVGQ